MPNEFELVQAAYDRWTIAVTKYREELRRISEGGKLDTATLKTLSDDTAQASDAFLDAVKARQATIKRFET